MRLFFVLKLLKLFPQGLEVKDQAPPVRLRQMPPAGHGGAGQAFGDHIENILVGWNFTKGRGSYFDMALGEISWPGAGIGRRYAISFPGVSVAPGAFLGVNLLPFFQGRLRGFLEGGFSFFRSSIKYKKDYFPDFFLAELLFPSGHG